MQGVSTFCVLSSLDCGYITVIETVRIPTSIALKTELTI